MSKITIGTRVMFTSAVVRQAGHSARTANMRGDVLTIAGKVATVRSIPLANLAPARLLVAD